MKRRAPWHDYSGRGLYLITLVVEGRRPMLGALAGEPIPHIAHTPLGTRILQDEVHKIHKIYPNATVWKTMVMPDHIHLIIYVSEPFPTGYNLSMLIKGFKNGCNRAMHQISPSAASPLFERGYNDKILIKHDSLNAWKRYLDDNPRRLWLKKTHPGLFTIMLDYDIDGEKCQIVGNQFLLDIPDKEAVIVHRSYTSNEIEALTDKWLACGLRGGVLVSAAIAPAEKALMRKAMDCGYRVILLRENGFPPLYKPAGEAFNACANGQLLQISPWEYHMQKIPITREKCLYLNRLAEKIAAMAPRR